MSSNTIGWNRRGGWCRRPRLVSLLLGLLLAGGCASTKMQSKRLTGQPISLTDGVVVVLVSDEMEDNFCRRFRQVLSDRFGACRPALPVQVCGCFGSERPVDLDSLLAGWSGRPVLLLIQTGTVLNGNSVWGFGMRALILDGRSRDVLWRSTARAVSNNGGYVAAIKSYAGKLVKALRREGIVECTRVTRRWTDQDMTD
jgi:hypothetical protein